MQHRTGSENGEMATRRPGGLPPAGAPLFRGGFPVDYGPRIDDRRQSLSSSASRPAHNGRDDQEDTPPSRHLWIGNVSQDASEAIIRDKFAQFGEVDSVTVYSSRNYAFVNFRNLDDAVEAKNRLQGFVLGGMAIRIEYAKGRMMKNEPARERGADSDYAKIMEEQVAARAMQSRHLWVGGISPNVSKEQIEGEFRKYGVMEDFKLLRERNCAFVDYVRIEDAVNAVEALNRTRIGDEELRVDYGRSQPSKRDFRGEQRGSQDNHAPQHGMQGGMGFGEGRVKADKDGGPSEILWVGFPLPSKVDEDGLRRAFMPYGEVERVKTFPGRTYAFVQFQKVEEATRAKNALDGKLFDDPRVHIRYSKSEIGPIDSPRDGPPSSQRMGDRQGFSGDVIGGPRGIPQAGSDRFGSPGRPSANPNSRLGGGLRPEYRPNALMAGLVDRGSSREPDGGPPGMGRRNLNHLEDMEYSRGIRPDSRSSYDDAWDLPDADIVPRDSKRLRVYPGGGADSPGFDPWYEQRQQQGSDSGAYGTGGPNNYEPLRAPATTDFSLGLGGRARAGLPGTDNNPPSIGARAAGSGHTPAPNSSVMSLTSPYSKHAVEDVKGPEGWQWHGTIAKGGTPVCRARCLPVGKGIDATVPDVVNCTARTDLDMLAKHVYQAGGFGVVFFVPEGDPDVPPYQDFMHYLGEKHRAGVAKLADGTTLFLVPPSEFSEKVLKVPGDNCLFGVVLKFQQPAPTPVISYNPSPQQQQQAPPLSQHPPYSQQQIPSQHASGPQSQYSQNQTPGQHIPAVQEPLYQGFHPTLPHDSQPSQTGIPTSVGLNDSLSSSVPNSNSNNSPMLTQAQLASIAGLPGVLTPELIASLTALLPKTNTSQAASSTESNLAPPIVSKGMKTFTGISGMPVGSTQSLGSTPPQSDVRSSFRPSQNTPPGPAQGWLQQQNQQDRSQVGPPSYHSQAADQSSMFTSQPPPQQHHLPNPPQQLQQQQHQPQQSQQSPLQVQPTHMAGPAAPGGQGPGFAGPPLHQQGYTGPSGPGVQQFPPLPQMPRPPQQPMGAPQQHLGAPPQLPGDQLAQLTALLTQRQQQPSQQQAASQLLQQHFQQNSNPHSSGQASGVSQPQGPGPQSQSPLQQLQPPQGPPQGPHQGPPQGPPQGPQGPQGHSQGPPQGHPQGPPQGPPQQPQPPSYGQYSQPSWAQVSAPQSSGQGNSQPPLAIPQLQQQNTQSGGWENALSQASAGVEQQAGFQNQGAGDADAQTKRFQATVQLAAALLQQMQQQQGKPSGGQEQR